MQTIVQLTQAEYEAMQINEKELAERIVDLERIVTYLALDAGGELNVDPIITLYSPLSPTIIKENGALAPHYKVIARPNEPVDIK